MKKGIYDRKSLLTFKEIAERGKQYTLFSYGDGPVWDVYTEAFLFRHNADVSVDIIETFGDVIEKLNNNGRVIEDITLGLDFSIFVDTNSLDDNGYLVGEPSVYNDKVSVRIDNISGHYSDGRDDTNSKSFSIIAGEKGSELLDGHSCITNFSDFVIGLNKIGFELEEIASFDDVKTRVLNGEKAQGSVSLATTKDRVYKKSDK